MKFCNNCGAQLQDDVKFCNNCGAAQIETNVSYSAPAPEPDPVPVAPVMPVAPKTVKKKKKGSPLKVIIPIVVVLLIAAAAVYLISSGVFANPATRFVKMHKAITDPVVSAAAASVTGNYEQLEEKADLPKIDTDLTITAEVDSPYYADEMLDLINDATVTMKAKVDKSGESILELSADIADTDALEGTLVWSKDMIGFSVPALSDEYYTLNFSDIKGILEDYGDMLGIDMDEFEETYDKYYDMATGKTAPVDMKQADLEKLINKYIDIVLSVVTKENTEKSSGKVELFGLEKSVDCDVLVFTPTADDIDAMLEKLVETAKDDKELKDLLAKIMTEVYVTMGYDEDDAEDEIDDMLDEFDDMLDELLDLDLGDEIEDLGFSITVGYKGDKLYTYQIWMEEDDEGIGFELYEKDGKGACCAAYYEEGGDESFVPVLVEYKVSGKTYKGTLTIDDGWDQYEIEFNLDTSKKTPQGFYYGTVSFEVDDVTIDVEVKAAKKGTDYIITVEVDDEEFEVTVNASDSSTASKPKGKGTAIDADSLEDVLEDLQDGAADFMEEISDLLY